MIDTSILPQGGRNSAKKKKSENPLPELCPFCQESTLACDVKLIETKEGAARTTQCLACGKEIVLRDKLPSDAKEI